ncbi:MAG: SCP2 sterol-binding domain-containing protein [Burkholderiales bacterium]|nr:SCP2 sterol-binding domain-containing protein [Burkholderiales bacterium]
MSSSFGGLRVPSPRWSHLAPVLRRLPVAPPSVLAARMLNHLLWPRLDIDQRRCLQGATIEVEAVDWGLRVRLQLGPGGFRSASAPVRAAVRADAAAFWALCTGQADADRLFFEGRLLMQGDTALALAVKSTLEAVGPLWPR